MAWLVHQSQLTIMFGAFGINWINELIDVNWINELIDVNPVFKFHQEENDLMTVQGTIH